MSFVFSLFTLFFILFRIKVSPAFAIYDPTSKANNIFGIHILFPYEISDAARLVNSNGGDWGYVTIPIQATDKNIQKWQDFMNQAKLLHVIPIIRIATEEDFVNKGTWRIPDDNDIVDFANFLSSLSWPTENRYIILFNEVNRYDEWGGQKPDPVYYANLVSFAYKTFKARNKGFFLLLSGMDNASIDQGNKYMNEFDYLAEMKSSDPGIFNNIDGIASHSYPNPAFSQPPTSYGREGTSTFQYEYEYVNFYANVQKPVFITETGWDDSKLSQKTVAVYYKTAFEDIWEKNEDKIVAITPFILRSINGPFDGFSFFSEQNKPTVFFTEIQDLPKTKGKPVLDLSSIFPQQVLAAEIVSSKSSELEKTSPCGTKFSKTENSGVMVTSCIDFNGLPKLFFGQKKISSSLLPRVPKPVKSYIRQILRME